MNETKKYIIIFIFVFCFFTGFWARGKIFNDKSKILLQTAGQELESARLENIELRKNLNLAIAELTISKESLKEAETIAEKQKTSLDNLNKSLQDLSKQYKKSKILYTTAIVILSSVIIGQTMYFILR